jgi:hypothetical protein
MTLQSDPTKRNCESSVQGVFLPLALPFARGFSPLPCLRGLLALRLLALLLIWFLLVLLTFLRLLSFAFCYFLLLCFSFVFVLLLALILSLTTPRCREEVKVCIICEWSKCSSIFGLHQIYCFLSASKAIPPREAELGVSGIISSVLIGSLSNHVTSHV